MPYDLPFDLRSQLAAPDPVRAQREALFGTQNTPTSMMDPVQLGNWHDAIMKTGGGVGEGLRVVGNLANTPGQVARGTGLTLGNLLKGDMSGAQDIWRQTIMGLNPMGHDQINNQQLVQGMQLPDNEISRSLAGALTDPLLMGAAVKNGVNWGNRLAAGGQQAARSVAPTAAETGSLPSAPGVQGWNRTSAGWEPTPAQPITGGPGVRYSPNGTPTFAGGNGPASIPAATEAASGESTRFAISPDSPASNGVLYHPPPGGAAPTAPTTNGNRFANMMDARRNTTALHLSTDEAGNPMMRTVGGTNTPAESARNAADAIDFLSSPEGQGTRGFFSPFDQTVVLPEAAASQPATNPLLRFLRSEGSGGTMSAADQALDMSARGVRRHEMSHALTNIANPETLSFIPRLASNLRAGGQYGAGLFADEVGAHSAGRGSGLFNQMQGGVQFLSNPLPHYASQLETLQPGIGRLYNSMAIPRVGLAAGGAGTAGVAAALQAALGDQ